MKSKNFTEATGEKNVYYEAIRDIRWWRGFNPGRQNPVCCSSARNKLFNLTACSQGAKQTGLPNTVAITEVAAFSYTYYLLYMATTST